MPSGIHMRLEASGTKMPKLPCQAQQCLPSATLTRGMLMEEATASKTGL